MGDVNTVIESYAEYLAVKRKALWERYQRTRLTSPESALAEAIVFRVLQDSRVNPQVADVPGAGGPDFLCSPDGGGKFMVEATSFVLDKVSKDTSLPNEAPDKLRGQAFGLLTRQIEEKAAAKKAQFDALEVPGILAIASSHFSATLLFDATAAEHALISQAFWIAGKESMSTDFASSLFLRLEDDGTIAIKNASISAAMFISVAPNQSHVCGALSPAPTYRLDTRPLWQIPFIYLKDWPIENNRVRCDWTMGSKRFHTVDHAPIQDIVRYEADRRARAD